MMAASVEGFKMKTGSRYLPRTATIEPKSVRIALAAAPVDAATVAPAAQVDAGRRPTRSSSATELEKKKPGQNPGFFCNCGGPV